MAYTKKSSKNKNKINRRNHTWSTRQIFKLVTLLEIVLLLAAAIVIISNHKKQEQMKLALETPKTEEKKLPPDIRKKLLAVTPAPPVRVPILLYHYVEYVADKKDTFRQQMNTPPFIFEEQIKALIGEGFNFITARELGEALDGMKPLPPKPVLVTIDDGHWDVITDIVPILEKYHVKATVYVIPDFLNGSDFLSDKQLKEVIESGLVEVGAHTMHHIYLKGENQQKVKEEVLQSKQYLEKKYHLEVTSFAYPYGAFDLQAEKAVKDAGFETAMSTVPGIMQANENRYFLYRIRPGQRIGQYLLDWLASEPFNTYY